MVFSKLYKCTDTEEDVIDFRSTGGTDGKTYDNILNHKNLTYLFCVSNDRSEYVIPIKDIVQSGNVRSISLRKEPNKNNQGFETYKYLVLRR